MGRDMILKDDEGTSYSYSTIRTQAWLEGQPSGLDAAASWLMDRAVTMFREGDPKAEWLRHLAKTMKEELEPRMRKAAKEHARDYPEQVDPNDE